MNHYMVEIDLPPAMTEEFLSLIPRQRAHVNGLMNEGRILAYTLAGDRSRLWVVVVAESEDEVKELVSTFPLAGFMLPTIHELAFHHNSIIGLMHFSVN